MNAQAQSQPTQFQDQDDPIAARYWEELESAMMAETIAASADLPPARRKSLLKLWAPAVFNAAAFGLDRMTAGSGTLEWDATDRNNYVLTYRAAYGMAYPLAKIYHQPNDTWAALVVAGVKDDLYEAMAQCEWAVSRLTAP